MPSTHSRKSFIKATFAQARGISGEDFAEELYQKARFKILARDWNYQDENGKKAQIDLIAERNGCIHFVEVKMRKTLKLANLAISSAQIARIAWASEVYMKTYPIKLFQIDALLLDHKLNWERIDNLMVSLPLQ